MKNNIYVLTERNRTIMKKDLVSVLMVNYNHADTIEKSIRSVLEQTYSKLQLIIVDDGSTDNSVEIINSIDDPRVV